jgi:hypothetical protein
VTAGFLVAWFLAAWFLAAGFLVAWFLAAWFHPPVFAHSDTFPPDQFFANSL